MHIDYTNMDFTLVKPEDYREFKGEHITLRDVQRTSGSKRQFSIDLYNKRRPLLVQTPTLTLGAALFPNDPRNDIQSAGALFLMRNIEWERSVQNFYHFLSYLEHAIIVSITDQFSLADEYMPVYSKRTLTEEEEIYTDYDFIYTDSNRHLSLRAEVRSDITSVYTRFQKVLTTAEVFGGEYLKRNARIQSIMEAPRVWFETDEKKRITKMGITWTVIQMKIIDQTGIPKCVIGEETPVFLTVPKSVPPPPPPLPMPLRPPSLFNSSDLQAGLGALRKKEANPDPPPPPKAKPLQQPGFTAPSLDDITSRIKGLKSTGKKLA